jgi:DNA integrity scanning protein DisA with diadenylate cyclase activity
MQFFIPGILLFLVAILISFLLAPRFTPLVAALLSLALLTYGVYDHYKMFAAEYRLSTWQDSLKIYAPAIMIGAITLFIIYAILAFFTKGSVPVPPLPNIVQPNMDSATNQIMNSLNKIGNVFGNTNNTNVVNKVNNQINNANKNRNNILGLNNTGTNEGKNENTNKKNNNVSRSFLETI